MNKVSKHTSAQVVAAIRGTGAIKQTIADRLGVHRHTIDRYLRVYPAAMQAFVNESEAQGDYAETVIITQLHETEPTGEVGSNGKILLKPTETAVETAKWYLVKKHKSRGYGDAFDITSGGKPLNWKEFIGGKKDEDSESSGE